MRHTRLRTKREKDSFFRLFTHGDSFKLIQMILFQSTLTSVFLFGKGGDADVGRAFIKDRFYYLGIGGEVGV